MSHESHGHHHDAQDAKPIVEYKAAWYFVLIVAGLFIGAIAFVQSMSHDESGHGDAHGAPHATEAPQGSHAEGHGTHSESGHGQEAEHH